MVFNKPISAYMVANAFTAWPKRVAAHLDELRAEKSRSDCRIITGDSD